jgi:hypothetical protein
MAGGGGSAFLAHYSVIFGAPSHFFEKHHECMKLDMKMSGIVFAIDI